MLARYEFNHLSMLINSSKNIPTNRVADIAIYTAIFALCNAFRATRKDFLKNFDCLRYSNRTIKNTLRRKQRLMIFMTWSYRFVEVHVQPKLVDWSSIGQAESCDWCRWKEFLLSVRLRSHPWLFLCFVTRFYFIFSVEWLYRHYVWGLYSHSSFYLRSNECA